MKRILFKSVAKFCAAGAVFFAASPAFAVGPSYQYVPDPLPVGATTISHLNDVVSLTGGALTGSGTIIGATSIPINATQSDEVLSILTCDHVAVFANTVNFGAGPSSPGAPIYLLSAGLNGKYQPYTLVDPINNPKSLPEDIAVMQANILYNNAAPSPTLTTIINNVCAIDNQFAAGAGQQKQSFTQVGYGQGGVWNGTGYNANLNSTGARRFQNNNSTNLNAPNFSNYLGGRYFQPTVDDMVLAPNVPLATGAGLQGDSGGPWFTTNTAGAGIGQGGTQNGTVTVTPQIADFLNGVAPIPANTVLNVNFSNNVSAEFVSVDTSYGLGTVQSAVPLLTTAQTQTLDPFAVNQGNYDWASDYANDPLLVPEPGTLSLIALGGFALLRRRSRQ